MSKLPPPGSYGTAPPSPPWQNQSFGGLTPQMPPKKSNTSRIVFGAIAVAVLAIVGVVVRTRGDDTKSIASTDSTSADERTDESEPETDDSASATAVGEPTVTPTTGSAQPTRITLVLPTITTSLPNASIVPPTAPPVTAPTTTVPFVLPPGAVDLGHQVYIPVPEGFTDTKSNSGLDTISNADGSTQVSLQVLSRTVGESPAVLMQEYADTFSADYAATNFTASTRYTLSGPVPVYEYGSYYETYDPDDPDGVSFIGGLYVFQRADGLSAIYDVFGPAGTMGLPDAAFQGFLSSFSAAPLLGPAGALQPVPTFRPTTSMPVVAISNVLGFTPAPDFAPSTDPNGGTRVSSAEEDFTIDLLPAQASSDAAVQAAQALLGAEYTGVTIEPLLPFPPYSGLPRVGIQWSGTYTDGNAVNGAIDVYWDPNTKNALAITRAWYTYDDGQEPAVPQTLYMSAAITGDIVFGIPNP